MPKLQVEQTETGVRVSTKGETRTGLPVLIQATGSLDELQDLKRRVQQAFGESRLYEVREPEVPPEQEVMNKQAEMERKLAALEQEVQAMKTKPTTMPVSEIVPVAWSIR